MTLTKVWCVQLLRASAWFSQTGKLWKRTTSFRTWNAPVLVVTVVAEANPRDNLKEEGFFSRWAGSMVLCAGVW